MHKGEPHLGHHRLLADVRARCGRATLEGVAPVEQVAILAQLIGALIHDLDGRQYDTAEIMRAVSLNIASGNQGAGGSLIGVGPVQ